MQNNKFVTRNDQSVLGRWWWTVDHWTLMALASIVSIGILLIMAASPPIAERLGLVPFYFVKKQAFLFLPGFLMILLLSLLKPLQIRRLATLSFLAFLVLMVATLFFGVEIKGARRWLSIGGFSLQVSEFLKPAFFVVTAWMFAEQKKNPYFPGNAISIALFLIVITLLMAQPDLGMTMVVTAVWGTQFFISGLPLIWVWILGSMGILGLISAYLFFPHVQSRIDRFLEPGSGDTYQIEKSLEAFQQGGFFGRGPGEGRVKEILPDAYADFIFPVAGEEFGIILCLLIVGLYIFILLRGFNRLIVKDDTFSILAGVGLLMQLGIQAFINMASSLHLIPTKGMTLPFISYGGSSFLALCFSVGMILSFTRRRHD